MLSFTVEQTIVSFVENSPIYDVLDEVLGEKIPHPRKKSGKYTANCSQNRPAENPRKFCTRGSLVI
jgi:hypothetical protein